MRPAARSPGARPRGPLALARAQRPRSGGFAMVVVLLVLLALLVLCAPFLLTVRNADASSSAEADRAAARVALDTAMRHARAELLPSHPALDETPYVDAQEELTVETRLDPAFLDAQDPGGAMWDVHARDVSGLIDLNSAPPQLLAELVGGATRLLAEAPADAKELSLVSSAAFPPQGFVWVERELVGYGEIEGGKLGALVRGLGASPDEESDCGPRPATAHPRQAAVLDDRAVAIARWRALTPDGELRRFDTFGRLREAGELALGGALDEDALAALARATSVHAGVAAGAAWQRATRLTSPLQAGVDCRLGVADSRWFSPGTTVRIDGGATSELGIVVRAGPGSLQLLDPVRHDYDAYAATVAPLARRPVNVNTASPEVLRALVLNLQLVRRSATITAREADALVEVIVQSRPFDGFEDFVRRVVLPAGGFEPLPADAPRVPDRFREQGGLEGEVPAILDPDDARALYKNALNANDTELVWSTMPFTFTSTGVHALELRAAVNAPSGIERAVALRDEVRLVVPQEELLRVFARQEDFDLALRLDRQAPGWATGPENTGRHDPVFGSTPPTRSRAHLGPADTYPSQDPLQDERTYTFASREDDGWIQPAPSRVAEVDELQGRVLHFDDESRQLEGRYLPDGVVSRPLDDELVGWASSGGLLRPLALSMWLRPRSLAEGEHFLDVAGPFPDTDRIELLVEDAELVLRVRDGAGDHPGTPLEDFTEARWPIGQGAGGPGLPLDTWSHVAIDVRGSAPSQVTMLVDGRLAPKTPGLTRLTAGIGSTSDVIPVESTEGFPSPCVIRIGNELVEVTVGSDRTFLAVPQLTGPMAGFGGRIARVPFENLQANPPAGVPTTVLAGQSYAHPAGAAVELYGYSTPILDQVPLGAGELQADLGVFGVARAIGAVGASQPEGEPIYAGISLLGFGMLEQGSNVTGIVLASPDDPELEPSDFMGGFSKSGGYALLAAPLFDLGGYTQTGTITQNGTAGGLEIVRYTTWTESAEGPVLEIVAPHGTGVNLQGGPELPGTNWVFVWDPDTVIEGGPLDGEAPAEHLTCSTFVIPISVPAGPGYPREGTLGVAQITRASDAELTEWVRYDEVTPEGWLVRSSQAVLEDARLAACLIGGGRAQGQPAGTGGGPPIGGGGGGGGAGSGGGGGGPGAGAALLLAPEPPPAAAAPQGGGSAWTWQLGVAEDLDRPVTRAVRTALRHRGVLGTFPHAHLQGTKVLPVWRMLDSKPVSGGVQDGVPGRFDPIMLASDDATLPPFPATVFRAVRPRERLRSTWVEQGLLAAPGSESAVPDEFSPPAAGHGYVLLALDDAAPTFPIELVMPAPGQVLEARTLARVMKHPTGELPRLPVTALVGGDVFGGGVPSAVVDEIAFGTTDFGKSAPASGETLWGGRLVLTAGVGAGGVQLRVDPSVLRSALWEQGYAANFLAELPPDGGLLRIGDEILAYESLDAPNGVLVVPAEARGLLGTDPAAHEAGEAIAFLEHWPATVLTAGVSAEASSLPVKGTTGFPPAGLVRVGDELVHYSWIAGGALEMPRAASEPGARDGKGGGIFRGRFGTQPAAHAAGTAVVLFPYRYADHWADGADAPELAYFQLAVDQPNAFWRSVAWQVEETGVSGPRLRVLQRTSPDVPWDAPPDVTEGLALLEDGLAGGRGNPIGAQSDRVEWRVHVHHDPGSFDPLTGASHGWKSAPHLRWLAVEHLAPELVLERVER